MSRDTVVFDIETQNFFTDPGVGWNNYAALKISVVCLYSYSRDAYLCFEERDMPAMAEFFLGDVTIVGFSSNRYDIPVLQHYFQRLPQREDLDLWKKRRIDLLDEIETATGSRISLSRLAQANLGIAKDRNGAEAITLYQEGNIEELKSYCRKDVEITKAIYDIFRERRALLVPNRITGETDTVKFPITLDL
jgi:DEAD/DEAH box helicase domain-containing protein